MASTLVLVGWDDVKCRPIYCRAPKSSARSRKPKAKIEIGTGGDLRGSGDRRDRAGPTPPPPSSGDSEAVGRRPRTSRGKGKASVVAKRRKKRTVSLSPRHAAAGTGKKVRWAPGWGDGGVVGVTGREGPTPATTASAAEDEATSAVARGSVAPVARAGRRRRGYGTRASAGPLVWPRGGFVKSKSGNGETECAVHWGEPCLQGEVEAATKLDQSEGGRGRPSLSDESTDVSAQGRASRGPASPIAFGFGGHGEGAAVSFASEEKEVGRDSPCSKLSESTSNVGFDGDDHSGGPTRRRKHRTTSPVDFDGPGKSEEASPLSDRQEVGRDSPCSNTLTSNVSLDSCGRDREPIRSRAGGSDDSPDLSFDFSGRSKSGKERQPSDEKRMGRDDSDHGGLSHSPFSDASLGSKSSSYCPTLNAALDSCGHDGGPSDEKQISSDAPVHGASCGSPNSDTSVGSHEYAVEPLKRGERSPMQRSSRCDVSIKSSVIFDGHGQSKAVGRPYDEKDIGSGDSADHGIPSYSPNSIASFDEEPIQLREQRPDDGRIETVNQRDSAEIYALATKSSTSTPSKLPSQETPPTSIDSRSELNTPNSGIVQLDSESNKLRSPTFLPEMDSPLNKGEESTLCPDSECAKTRHYAAADFDDFDVTFDEPRSPAQPKEKRRSYGNAKPVWVPNKLETTAPGALGGHAEVGWDEALCRPIYAEPPARDAPPRDAPDGLGPADGGPGALVREKRTQKKRVYTSFFKKTGLSRAVRDRMEIDSPSAVARTPTATSAVDRECYAKALLDENCNSCDAAKKASDEVMEDTPIDLDCRPNGELLDVDLELEAITHDSNTRCSQPTSKSSPASARAFFRYLDCNHRLTVLDQGARPDDRGARVGVIRTQRRMEECEWVRDRYAEYRETLRGTGVLPISLSEFARNWGLYFATEKGICRDGLLDEE